MSTFKAALSALKGKIKSENQITFNQDHLSSRKVKLGGSLISLQPQSLFKLPPNAYYGKASKNWTGEDVIVAMIGRPYDNAFVVKSSYEIIELEPGTDADNKPIMVETTKKSPAMTDMITLESTREGLKVLFFPEGCEFGEAGADLIPAEGVFKLKADLKLNDGSKLLFSSQIHIGTNVSSVFQGMGATIDSNGESSNEVPLYGVSKLGIADFRRVEQEVSCYVPGEVSHIENIMAREYKERFSRKQKTIDITSETSSESEIEQLSDTTTTERNEMSSEASSVLNEDRSKSYGATASVSGELSDAFSYSASASADFSSSSSSSDSNSMAKSYAQDITERALERVVNKVSKKRTSRMIQEFEEHNKHGFDNTEGTENLQGIYRWVDKIYKNNLVNYGKRLMYEFAIPEPAKFYKEAIIQKISKGVSVTKEPIPPMDINLLPIKNAQDITEDNYLDLAKAYGAQVEAPVLETITVSNAYSYWGDRDANAQLGDYASVLDAIKIPEGYLAKTGQLKGTKDLDNDTFYFDIMIGDLIIKSAYFEGPFDYPLTFGAPISESVAVSMQADEVFTAAFNITVNCERSSETFEKWQNETYNAILNAYNELKERYDEALMAYLAEEEIDNEGKPIRFNPLFNRSIERREIKRIAIELMAEPFGVKTAKSHYEKVNTKNKVKKSGEFQDHASVVKFFEQAFDWEIMAYMFYPYFYADENDWIDLFQSTDAADPIFQAFLQSGMSRAVVPVRPGFEDAVNWYLATGEVWNGQGIIVDENDDMYLSIAEEMRTVEGKVEEVWETRVPTALTILQAQSEGLPCFDETHDHSA